MADIKWIKIVTDIFDDEKIMLIESLPDSYALIVCWFKLLCFAGKQNNNGIMMLNDKMAYTDEMLATVFRMNPLTVKLALGVFEKYGMIVIADDVIQIKNWQKYQSFKDKATYNEYMRDYMKERYHKQKQLTAGDGDFLNKNLNKNLNVLNQEEIRNKNKEERKKNKEERINNSTKADKSAGADSVISSISNPELQSAVTEFVKYRKELKKPLSDHALTLLLNKLDKLAGSDAEKIEILNQSMINGWQGIFALDKRQQGKTGANGIKLSDKYDSTLDSIF